MADDRKNIKVSRELFEKLDEKRPERDTWEQYLEKLFEQAPVRAKRVRIEDGQVNDIARKTADELEERLR